MTLYDIADELLNLQKLEVDEETGEIDLKIEEEIERLNFTKDKKIVNIWKLLKNWKGELDIFDSEIKRLSKRKATLTKYSDRLKSYVQQFLEPGKEWKSKDDVAWFKWRKSTACNVYAENLINDKYMITTKRPDLIEIKSQLKSGEEIDGVELITKQNLVIK